MHRICEQYDVVKEVEAHFFDTIEAESFSWGHRPPNPGGLGEPPRNAHSKAVV